MDEFEKYENDLKELFKDYDEEQANKVYNEGYTAGEFDGIQEGINRAIRVISNSQILLVSDDAIKELKKRLEKLKDGN